MTLRDRVRAAQRTLAVTVVLAALLWAASLAMLVIVLAASIDALGALPIDARLAILPLAMAAALIALALVLWRGRAVRSTALVALWIEEREPRLSYALVTAIDPSIAPRERFEALHEAGADVDISGIVRHAWQHALGRAVIACAVLASALLVLQPRDLLDSASAALSERAALAPPAPMANRLLSLAARITPPAYTRLPAVTLDEPSGVTSLIGSRVTLEGKGTAEGVTGTIATQQIGAVRASGGWSIGITMPKDPAVLALRDRFFQRLVVMEPVTDSAPDVKLKLPARDTTYQQPPKGKLQIEAALADDFGLSYGYFEYMLSTGSEETFETKQILGAQLHYDNARHATLGATIDLDTMKLRPGSVLHIRAIALDYNDVTGPGKGISETRTLRVAELLDSTSINAAAPLPIDSMWISQRLLNMRTDTLIRTKRKMDRVSFTHASSGYSNGQEDIRRRALSVIALLEDNGVGGSFATDASKMLREAVDLMFTAREDLGVAQPDSAMPYMKKILKILDDLRLAHRYYLRGLMKPVAVNIERVRLTGKDSARAAARKARAELEDAHAALARRIDVAAAIARTSPQVAADSLTFIRVSALTRAPEVSEALRKAIDLLREGAAADSALSRTRRALEPRARIGAGGEWMGVVR